MAVVELKNSLFCLETRGKYGRPSGFGNVIFGASVFEKFDPLAGIYQKRPRKKGQIFVRMKYYIMPRSNTPAQQAQRQKIRDAINAWRALSFDEQIKWNKARKPRGCSGYQYFCKVYMR